MPRLSYPKGRQAAAVVTDPAADEPETLIEGEPEPEVVEPQDDPTVALKARIAELEKAQTEQKARIDAERQRAEEASKRAQERDAEVTRLQQDTFTSQAEAIDAALAAANAEAESAQRDMESAAQLGDYKAQAEAQRKISRAEARIHSLENGKEQLELQRESAKQQAEQAAKQKANDPLESINLPPLAKDWLRVHPEFLYDGRKNAKIQALHWDVVDEGHAPYSQSYFETLEQKLGMRQAPVTRTQVEEDDDVEEPPRKAQVSAPPSREVPTASGSRPSQIRLTVAQKEAAKIAGISEADYAKQLIRLQQEKSNGNYGGGQ